MCLDVLFQIRGKKTTPCQRGFFSCLVLFNYGTGTSSRDRHTEFTYTLMALRVVL